MALIKATPDEEIPETPIPHEPGEWVKVRTVTAGMGLDAAEMAGGSQAGESKITACLLVLMLAGWSYDAPINLDTIRQLDGQTFRWLSEQLQVTGQVRPDAEKKDSGGS